MQRIGSAMTVLVVASCSNAPPAIAPTAYIPPRLVSRPALIYPAKLLADGKEGSVQLSCEIETDGTVRDCVISTIAGDSAFGSSAIHFIEQSRYVPATKGGVPVSTRRSFSVSFDMTPKILTLAAPVVGPKIGYPLAMRGHFASARIVILCDIGTDGQSKNCQFQQTQGDVSFKPQAMHYAQLAEYRPAMLDGVPVETHEHQFICNFIQQNQQPNFAALPPAHPSAGGISLESNDHVVTVSCRLQIDGTTSNCFVQSGAYQSYLNAKGLAIASVTHFPPLILDGKPRSESSFVIKLIFPTPPKTS